MKSILIVEDDPVIAEVYRRKLAKEGYQVDVAGDGLVAMKMLHVSPPDLVVLDIMMPKFNGLEVLNHIRGKANLKATKVVVLSNFYISGDEREAATAKADAAFLKSSCTPGILVEVVGRFLSADATPPAPVESPAPAPAPAAAPAPTPAPKQPSTPKQLPIPKPETDAEGMEKVRESFWGDAPATLAELERLNLAFVGADSPRTRELRLLEFYRKVHFVAALASMAGCESIALLTSAFEALLLDLHEKPDRIGPSTGQTIASALEVLGLLFTTRFSVANSSPLRAQPGVLIVDDDAIASRTMSIALKRSNLNPICAPDSASALELLASAKFDLIMLDVKLPGMDGFELRKYIRAMPQHQKTPVIFITGHTEFSARANEILSGGDELLTKPIFPIELAVKTLSLLIRSRLIDSPPSA